MVSHIDVTIRLDRIYNMLLPPEHSQQALQAVPGSPTSHLGPYARNEESGLGDLQLESCQTVAEIIEVEEHKRTVCVDHQETFEEQLFSREQRLKLKWLCWSHQQNAEDRSAYDLLKDATNNFSSRNKIGVGGWSTVYKAHIGGLEVAIKRYPTNDATSHASQFDSEFQILKELQHKNIIKLLGHYAGQGERILVYEYMPNGSLDKFIFDVRPGASIDWMSRFHIMEGIAQGLLYLHVHEQCIVHKDLKPSNILLDSDMNAKISDFGIATMLRPEFYHDTCISGTFGYMAPEYLREGILSPKVDVYAYGVILLEVISAKKSSVPWFQGDKYVTLTGHVSKYLYFFHAWHLWATMRLSELLDPLLCNGQPISDITRCIQIALLCVQKYPADRPSMSEVLLMLDNRMTIPSPKLPDDYRADSHESKLPDDYRADSHESKLPDDYRADSHEYQADGHEYQAYGYGSETMWSLDITWPR
ncbi:hypothetical protein EJB05_55380 [Eragrostis curvula]|uniref:Protein kinase domain-containing protein n=1 Tax=Eragrostis curvula TaxID=38414 RepID=A0A5J9SJW5_9POAL|nr:hypothetical protein EJB05_55380 [Eragrostis curvula]